jgi:hypothetical protein
MHMHIREFDWRIEPLHDVIVGIDAGLAAIHERLNAEEGFDGISGREHAEALFGLGFVAAQSYALGTVSDLNSVRMSRRKPKKEKLDCYACDSIALKGGVTRIQLINASANYFKHHDEWVRWPTGSDRGAHDTKALRSVGITEKTEFPCIDAVDLLCGTSWELIVLHQILKEWRVHLFGTLL